MKKLSILLLLLLPFLAMAQVVPTTLKGDARYTNYVIVSTRSCKLYSATSYNSSSSTVYLQIFQTNGIPRDGSLPKYSYPVPATSFISFDFNTYGLDLDACVIFTSSTTPTLTGITNSSIQAIIHN